MVFNNRGYVCVRARKSPWIETSLISGSMGIIGSGLVRARGLKPFSYVLPAGATVSGLVRARGLKQTQRICPQLIPVRARKSPWIETL